MEFETPKSKVYIQTDTDGRILRCEGEYTLPSDLNGWTLIEEGPSCDRLNLAQSHYFDGGLYTMDGIPRYRWDGTQAVERTNEELEKDRAPSIEIVRSDKLAELSASCNAAITAGMDVETTQGTEHFSLQETDQINLTTAPSAVQSGASGYPYHADGQLCRLFTAAEIQAIAAASVRHKLYHTTLCNHLLTWARRAEAKEELSGITYAADGLPEDLAANMALVLAAAGDNNA